MPLISKRAIKWDHGISKWKIRAAKSLRTNLAQKLKSSPNWTNATRKRIANFSPTTRSRSTWFTNKFWKREYHGFKIKSHVKIT